MSPFVAQAMREIAAADLARVKRQRDRRLLGLLPPRGGGLDRNEIRVRLRRRERYLRQSEAMARRRYRRYQREENQ